MANQRKFRCIRALQGLKQLMDLHDEFDAEQPKKKSHIEKNNRVVSNEIEAEILKDIAWKCNDNEDKFCPMSIANYEEIVAMLEPEIRKTDGSVNFNKISFRIRVAITLRYLINGDAHRILGEMSHLSRTTVRYILPKMLKALVNVLEKSYLKIPTTENEWHDVANDFQTFWKFPHVLGIMDGKYICSRASLQTGGFSSLILLSVLDAHSRFIHIDVINSERIKPSDAYKQSKFYQGLTRKTFNIPSPKPLEGQDEDTRYSFLGDSIFGMDPYIIKAYDNSINLSDSQKTFNYRLRRARLPVDMAFEILFYRFQIFRRTNEVDVELCNLVIKACCLLHNFLTQKLIEIPKIEDDYVPLKIPKNILALPPQSYEKCNISFEMRDNICKYYATEEDVTEQWIIDIKNDIID